MATKMVRAEVELFDNFVNFSLWTIHMMGHFGVSGLKEVVLSDKFKIKVPVTKEEGKIQYDDQSGSLEKKTILDPLKLEKDE